VKKNRGENVNPQAAMEAFENYLKSKDVRKFPFALQYQSGTLEKPAFAKEEFYRGGFYKMESRVEKGLKPHKGAYEEFSARIENVPLYEAVEIMWDYITLV